MRKRGTRSFGRQETCEAAPSVQMDKQARMKGVEVEKSKSGERSVYTRYPGLGTKQ